MDLGGTNFRVCSIRLNGDTTFEITQSRVAIPRELQSAETSKELFSFLAKQIETFLKTHHNDHFEAHIRRRQTMSGTADYREEQIFQLGFTFSFPVNQVGINKGFLIRWTKGYNIKDAIGKDVCALLQDELDALHLPVNVAALVNDTVGTLMARSYTSPGKTGTLLGAIFGTGTNGAYVEKLDKVVKMATMEESADFDKSTGEMIINTEWGSFDNPLRVLPNTSYDDQLDKESVNPGIQMFEKRVSGMFLGEILRRVIISMMKDPNVQLFKNKPTTIADNSPLYEQWGIDTKFLSDVLQDETAKDYEPVKHWLEKNLKITKATAEDEKAIQILVTAIGKRAARLSAVAMGAVVISTGKLDNAFTGNSEDDVVDIGVDGSLVEKYPHFQDYIREGLREITAIGVEGEKRIRIGLAQDGSGVGAALIALVADRVESVQAPNR